MQVRPASTADAALLAALARRLYEETFRGTCADADLELHLERTYTEERLAGELVAARSWYFVVEDGGEAAGYAWVGDGTAPNGLQVAKVGELKRFYVDRRWHGRGAAQLLMEQCVRCAREQGGYDGLFLGVWEQNPRAIRFYGKCGFTPTHAKQFFLVGNDPQVDVVMEMLLQRVPALP
jgi:diamine N-acetyltransferase